MDLPLRQLWVQRLSLRFRAFYTYRHHHRTVIVYHCVNGDGRFEGQIWFGAHSTCQCNFDGDRDGNGNGDGTCKRTFMLIIWRLKVRSFTHTVNVWCFNVMCKQYRRNALNRFLNGTKNYDVDGMCKRSHKYTSLSIAYSTLNFRVWQISQAILLLQYNLVLWILDYVLLYPSDRGTSSSRKCREVGGLQGLRAHKVWTSGSVCAQSCNACKVTVVANRINWTTF